MTPKRLHEMLTDSPLPYTTDLDLVNGHLSMRVAGIIVRRKTKGWVVNGCHFPCIIPDSAPIWIVHGVILTMISQSLENDSQ